MSRTSEKTNKKIKQNFEKEIKVKNKVGYIGNQSDHTGKVWNVKKLP